MNTNQRSIFIVDDERIITSPLRRLIRNMLRENDLTKFRPVTANDPRGALDEIQKLKDNGADLALVIADIMMPQMNGLDFLAQVKTLYPLAPRVVLTGYADKENAVRALNELDLFYYVEKPWDDDRFKQLALRALQKYRQDRIEAMFRLYVPYEVIEEYVDQSDEAFLVGKEMEATVLFLDIVDFTHMSEKMDARDVVALLNEYLTELVEIIHEHGGILDKFTGDGLMAIFGAPSTRGGMAVDAANAVRAALDMVSCVASINARHEERSVLRVRIGLNTGPVVVGNIGSQRRVNYTAVSDTVNTAARIEDAARYVIENDFACILISRRTYEQVKENLDEMVSFEAQEPVKLKGKTQEQYLYRVVV